MPSTINASNGSISGLISTGDASGDLQLQVNNGTPAVTLNTSGAIGVGSSPSYGTSGQVLTSSGSGSAPTWSTVEALPSQTGENGKYLTTNGTIASWGTLPTTNLATGVTGTLPTANGGTGLTTVGTNGQVLSSNGSTLTWTTPSAGAMTLISTQTASGSSSLSWTGLTGYNAYVLIVNNIVLSNSSNWFRVQVGYGETPTYISTGYRTAGNGSQGAGAAVYVNSVSNESAFGMGRESGIQNNSPVYGNFTFYGISSQIGFTGQLGYYDSNSGYMTTMASAGTLTSGTYPITALKVYMNVGTITSGSISLYGIS